MSIRGYDPKKDREAALRIWREVGWIGEEKKDEQLFDAVAESGQARVYEVDGSAECLVITVPGTVRHGKHDLKLSGVIAVTTSRIARHGGYASRLLADALMRDVEQGACVAGLGTFEQGFYNRLGFGTGSYEHLHRFDPACMKAYVKPRKPVRIGVDDWQEVHRCMLERLISHGGITLIPPSFTRANMLDARNGFGLGYREGRKLSHFMWFSAENVENGPYTLRWMAYRTWDQFLELMALITRFRDQVFAVEMCEPSGIQMQDFIEKPFHLQTVTEKGRFQSGIRSKAYWQMRICDLEASLSVVESSEPQAEFNLRLSDPIAGYLPPKSSWQGCRGDFIVTLGKSSGVVPGHSKSLPLLETSIGAFTRLWLGVQPGSGLAVTDDLKAPAPLLERLDAVFRLPRPSLGWEL